MSWLLFMDESGHDHGQLPYEVRGGVALHAREIWPFVRDLERIQAACLGAARLDEFKGSKLLDRDRFKWAAQGPEMSEQRAAALARAFLARS